MADRFDALGNHRHFDHNVFVEPSKRFAFTNHALEVGGDDFGTDVPVHNVTNGLVVGFHSLVSCNAFFGHQGRVGGDPVEDSEGLCFANLVEVGSVDEELHVWRL